MAGPLSKLARLAKLGAVAGLTVGVSRWIMQRRLKPTTAESSWPTIAETAAGDGHLVDGSETAEPEPDPEAGPVDSPSSDAESARQQADGGSDEEK